MASDELPMDPYEARGRKKAEEYKKSYAYYRSHYRKPRYENPFVTIERVIDRRLNRMRTEAEVYRIEAARLKGEGKDVQAGLQVSAYATAHVAVGAIEGLTLPFRPIAVAETAQSLIGLATSAEQRTRLLRAVATDPVGFVAELGGGYLGATVSPVKFTIKRKTVAKTPEPTSVAELQTRGAWPESGRVGFGKSRGSVVILQKPQLRELPRVPAYVDPYALTVAAARGLRYEGVQQDPRLKSVARTRPQQTYIDPITRMEPILRTEPRISQPVKEEKRERIRPLIAPVVVPLPIVRPQVVPTMVPPGYTQRTVQAVISRQIRIPRVVVIPDVAQIQEQRQRTVTLSLPQMRHISLEAPMIPLRRQRRKKKGYDPLSLDIWGEMREYPIKSAEKVLRSMKI